MHEHELERIARDLGDRSARAVDPEQVAARVVARLRATPVERASPLRRLLSGAPMLLRVAAAVAILAGAGLVTRSVLLERAPTAALMAPWLPELSTEELYEVMDSMAFETPVSRDLAVGLTDLTETQLRELLAQMEE